jgi:uncharacterized membrane protein YvbJ
MSGNFSYKIHCELIITSEILTPAQISEIINIKATRSYTKGDVFKSNTSGTEGKRINNLWAVKSDEILTNEENISIHLQYFIDLLSNKTQLISDLRNAPTNDVSFWVWIESNELGISTEMSERELSFLNKIVNRLHFTILSPMKRNSI